MRNVLNMPRERADIKVTFFYLQITAVSAEDTITMRQKLQRERYVEGNHPEDRSVCAWLPEHPAESREESSPAAP